MQCRLAAVALLVVVNVAAAQTRPVTTQRAAYQGSTFAKRTASWLRTHRVTATERDQATATAERIDKEIASYVAKTHADTALEAALYQGQVKDGMPVDAVRIIGNVATRGETVAGTAATVTVWQAAPDPEVVSVFIADGKIRVQG
jgi:hypothetical protein